MSKSDLALTITIIKKEKDQEKNIAFGKEAWKYFIVDGPLYAVFS